MIADIGFAVIRNGAAIVNIILALTKLMRMDCRIIAISAFSVATNAMMLTALCFDRLYSVIAPHHYSRNMTKRRGYVIVSAIWLIPFLLSFLNFSDPCVNSALYGITTCYSSFIPISCGCDDTKHLPLLHCSEDHYQE